MKECQIDFLQRRRFYQNELADKQHILIALHGYGQLAQYFSRKFQDLNENWGLVFPEGPHRFYLEGSSGRVGASWMTKEWRAQDIQENTNYLLELIGGIQKNFPVAKISLLGFSQGGATAARLFEAAPQLFVQLILWACVFPPDVKINHFPKDVPLHFVLGNEDPYFLNSGIELMMKEFVQLGFQTHLFHGAHDINSTTLSNILGLIS